MGNYFEGSGRVLSQVLYQHLPGGTEEDQEEPQDMRRPVQDW
jgi:hypothetical protein